MEHGQAIAVCCSKASHFATRPLRQWEQHRAVDDDDDDDDDDHDHDDDNDNNNNDNNNNNNNNKE